STKGEITLEIRQRLNVSTRGTHYVISPFGE
ncbi:hypothetical protein PMI10_03867, partial [Flavobacterium sp. CF136]